MESINVTLMLQDGHGLEFTGERYLLEYEIYYENVTSTGEYQDTYKVSYFTQHQSLL